MRFPLGEMTVGDILDRALKLLFARLPIYYAINLLVLFPFIVVQAGGPLVLATGGTLDETGLLANSVFNMLGVLLLLILQPIATAAILHLVMEEYAGRRASMADALAFAMGRFVPLLGASILVGLLVAVGWLLCCVPGIYFWVTYAFVGQIVVLERAGIGEAFQRSQALVTDYRWRVFGILLLIGLGNFIVQLGIGMGLNSLLPPQEVIPVERGVRVRINPLNHVIDTVVAELAAILFATYLAIVTTLLYLDLRIRKEGFDLELAAGGGPERRRRRRDDYDDYDDRDRYDDRDDRRRSRDDYDDRERDRYDDQERDRDRDRGHGHAEFAEPVYEAQPVEPVYEAEPLPEPERPPEPHAEQREGEHRGGEHPGGEHKPERPEDKPPPADPNHQ